MDLQVSSMPLLIRLHPQKHRFWGTDPLLLAFSRLPHEPRCTHRLGIQYPNLLEAPLRLMRAHMDKTVFSAQMHESDDRDVSGGGSRDREKKESHWNREVGESLPEIGFPGHEREIRPEKPVNNRTTDCG